jgi:hypothetical protein
MKNRRSKRQTSVNRVNNNLFLEFLIVADSSTYDIFTSTYGNLGQSLITQYMNIFFSQIVNGV